MTYLELKNAQDPVGVHYHIDGPIFREGMPIHFVISGLSEVQSIFDKTYLGLIGRKKFTSGDRSKFYLRAGSINHGSIETDLGIILTAGQVAFPFLNHLGPTGIWEYVKQTYEFLILVVESVKKNEPPAYSFSSKDNSVMNVTIGNSTHVYNAAVFNIAQLSLPSFQSLASLLAEGVVEHISLGTKQNPEIVLRAEDKEIFEIPTKIDAASIQINCEIFDFNKFDNVGKLVVHQDQTIAKGDYRFKVIGDQDIKEYIEAMLKKEVTVTCLMEFVLDPFTGTDKIKGLQVIKVA